VLVEKNQEPTHVITLKPEKSRKKEALQLTLGDE